MSEFFPQRRSIIVRRRYSWAIVSLKPSFEFVRAPTFRGIARQREENEEDYSFLTADETEKKCSKSSAPRRAYLDGCNFALQPRKIFIRDGDPQFLPDAAARLWLYLRHETPKLGRSSRLCLDIFANVYRACGFESAS